jgi:hypothetical protein
MAASLKPRKSTNSTTQPSIIRNNKPGSGTKLTSAPGPPVRISLALSLLLSAAQLPVTGAAWVLAPPLPPLCVCPLNVKVTAVPAALAVAVASKKRPGFPHLRPLPYIARIHPMSSVLQRVPGRPTRPCCSDHHASDLLLVLPFFGFPLPRHRVFALDSIWPHSARPSIFAPDWRYLVSSV